MSVPDRQRLNLHVLDYVASATDSSDLRAAAAALGESFGVMLYGLEMAAWNNTDENNLKHPMGKTAWAPREGELEERAETFVAALQAEPAFATAAFKCIGDFGVCRRASTFHVAWCIAALLACLAERLRLPSSSMAFAGGINMSQDKITVSHVVGPVNIKSRLDHVRQVVSSAPSLPDGQKAQLTAFVAELERALKPAETTQPDDSERVAQATALVAAEVAKQSPSKSFLALSVAGMKDAAKALATVAPDVLAVVGRSQSLWGRANAAALAHASSWQRFARGAVYRPSSPLTRSARAFATRRRPAAKRSGSPRCRAISIVAD